MSRLFGKRNDNAYLEDVRNKHGNEALKSIYHDAVISDGTKAAQWLNDARVHFPTLFVLRPEIIKAGLYPRLNNRNRGAFDLSDEILSGRLAEEKKGKGTDRGALLWMLESGQGAGGLGEHYDQVMDTAALLLAKVHGHRGCIRPIERLMFDRHRKGACSYDLIWAFFEASKPADLLLLAERLRSRDVRDVELARKLLNFVPCVENGAPDPYRCARRWILRNQNRLYYTGETNQQRSNPRRYALTGGEMPDEPSEGMS